MELIIGIAIGATLSASLLVLLGWYISREGYENTIIDNPEKNNLH